MIPKPYIAKWQDHAPWKQFHQVEQDLVINRALVEIFSDDFLKENLAFRGSFYTRHSSPAPARLYRVVKSNKNITNKGLNISYFWFMSRNYKFHNPEAAYFVSFSVIEWLDVFTRNEYKNILIHSLQFCQKEKGMEIYAWCVMTNHVPPLPLVCD
jgi:hypothetical protein